MLEDHLASQEASNQGLNLYYGYESAFIYLYAILIIIVFIFNDVFPRFDLHIILVIIIKCIFVLFFIGPNHHVGAIFIFFVSVAEANTLSVIWMKVTRLLLVHHVALDLL